MTDRPIPSETLPGDELVVRRVKAGQPPSCRRPGATGASGPSSASSCAGATAIDGTGAPPIGPTDIVVEGNRITLLKKVTGNLATAANRPAPGDHEIDCRGKWVTPGFIDCHAHAGVANHAANGGVPPVDCVYKLWLAHGVTTVRDMGSMNGLGWMLDQKKRSAENSIVAPRLLAYAHLPAVNDMLKTLHSPDEGRAWLRKLKERGADGVKFFGAPPAIMEAALDECRKLGLRSGCHHAQMAVTRTNALTTARWGLTSAEHYYGLPEALFEDRVVQDFPLDYDYNDEYFRFSVSGQMFRQGAAPGSAKWNEVLESFLALGFTFVPTFTIYDANRDLMRARQADWHKDYTWKSMWDYFTPQRGGHGSTGIAGRPRTRSSGRRTTGSGRRSSTSTKTGRPRLHRQRSRISSIRSSVSAMSRAGAVARGGLPSTRSHPLGDIAGRGPVRPAGRARHPGSRQVRRPAGARP